MCGIQTIPWKSGAYLTRIVCVKVARSSAQGTTCASQTAQHR